MLEARGHPPRHRDHRGRSAQRRLLRRRAGPAAGQEDGQPGQPDRLPPLLRRRERDTRQRPHLLRVSRVPRGRAGAGMVHTGSSGASPPRSRSTSGRSGSPPNGIESERDGGGPASSPIPRGSSTSCVVVEVADAPLIAEHPEVPAELALQGFHAVRAYSAAPEASSGLLEGARVRAGGEGAWEARGAAAAALYVYDEPPAERGLQGAGSVHHVAWASTLEEHEAWREKAIAGRRAADPGDRPLLLPLDLLPRAERRPLRDRDARPRLHRRRAARAPRREALLPPDFEHLRAEVEPVLTPLPDPRPWARTASRPG